LHYFRSSCFSTAWQVVVGTPGTVKRWIMRDKYLNPRTLRIFVLDEADKMVRTFPVSLPAL
jgi:ATP-dependent RNA helicase DDX19/DBP5